MTRLLHYLYPFLCPYHHQSYNQHCHYPIKYHYLLHVQFTLRVRTELVNEKVQSTSRIYIWKHTANYYQKHLIYHKYIVADNCLLACELADLLFLYFLVKVSVHHSTLLLFICCKIIIFPCKFLYQFLYHDHSYHNVTFTDEHLKQLHHKETEQQEIFQSNHTLKHFKTLFLEVLVNLIKYVDISDILDLNDYEIADCYYLFHKIVFSA